MNKVRAKKKLGQHFLKDQNIARSICDSLIPGNYTKILEIGPGMGVLTQYLLKNDAYETFAIDIDTESIDYLHNNYPEHKDNILYGDFLKEDVSKLFDEPFAIIGNFPYNISSQIFANSLR